MYVPTSQLKDESRLFTQIPHALVGIVRNNTF